MTWEQGDFTAIHNHGNSETGVVFFANELEHRTYCNTVGNTIELVSKEKLKTGTIAKVTGEYTHSMGNLSDQTAYTLHYIQCKYQYRKMYKRISYLRNRE